MSALPRTFGTTPAGRRRRPARSALAVGAALSLTVLAGCSSGDDSGSAGAGAATSAGPSAGPSPSTGAEPSGSPTSGEATGATAVTATETDFAIALDSDQLTAGEYTFEVVNDGSASHDLVVEQDGEDVAASDVVPPGKTTSVTVTLEPGEYVFYCSVGNHREMGMELTVQVT